MNLLYYKLPTFKSNIQILRFPHCFYLFLPTLTFGSVVITPNWAQHNLKHKANVFNIISVCMYVGLNRRLEQHRLNGFKYRYLPKYLYNLGHQMWY